MAIQALGADEKFEKGSNGIFTDDPWALDSKESDRRGNYSCSYPSDMVKTGLPPDPTD